MNRIKQFRNEANMTVRELAEKAKVAIGYISTLENDSENSANPSRNIMEKIAFALNSTVLKLFY